MGLFSPNVENLKSKKDVNGLIKALKYNNPSVRKAAAEALGSLGDPRAADPLITALHDPDHDVHSCAQRALGNIKDPRVIIPLLNELEEFSGIAKESLMKVRDVWTVEPFIAAIRDSNYYKAEFAVILLGRLGDQRAVDPLISLLQENFPNKLKAAVIETLEALHWLPRPEANNVWFWILSGEWEKVLQGGAESVEPLLAFVERQSNVTTEKYHKAVQILGLLGDSRAVEPLIKELRHSNSDGLIQALGRLGDARAVEPLLAKQHSYSEENLKTVAQALKDIGSPVVEPLLEMLQHNEDNKARSFAIQMLTEVGDPRAVEHLRILLQDDSQYIQDKAAESLRKLCGEQTAENYINIEKEKRKQELISRMECDESESSLQAAIELGKMGDGRAFEKLVNALNHENHYIARDAAEALGKLGDIRAAKPINQLLNDYNTLLTRLERGGLDEIPLDQSTLDSINRMAANQSSYQQMVISVKAKIHATAKGNLSQRMVPLIFALEKVHNWETADLLKDVCKGQDLQVVRAAMAVRNKIAG